MGCSVQKSGCLAGRSMRTRVSASDGYALRKPSKAELSAGFAARNIGYSEYQVAVKLEPSEDRPDGTDSFAPLVPLTMIDS